MTNEWTEKLKQINNTQQITPEEGHALLSGVGVDCYLRDVTTGELPYNEAGKYVVIRNGTEAFFAAFKRMWRPFTYECASCGVLGQSRHNPGCKFIGGLCNRTIQQGQSFILRMGKDIQHLVANADAKHQCAMPVGHEGMHQAPNVMWQEDGSLPPLISLTTSIALNNESIVD